MKEMTTYSTAKDDVINGTGDLISNRNKIVERVVSSARANLNINLNAAKLNAADNAELEKYANRLNQYGKERRDFEAALRDIYRQCGNQGALNFSGNNFTGELNKVKQAVSAMKGKLDEANRTIAARNQEIQRQNNQIKQLNGQVASAKKALDEKIDKLCEEIKILLLPKDENDDKNIIMEIRAAAGGEESALFATELLRMYTHYAESHRWKVEIMDISETELGGIKEVTFVVQGKGAYSRLKYEAGVHRVQRVPETESQGRIHTSTATVAVLPEMEEVDFEILDSDLRVDTYRASGAGGQHINKTDSAIRMTHLPTGIVVTCQDERSQIKNREKAMRIMQSKLYELYQSQKESEFKASRKSQVGTGDRSERVRTYNYPQGRVTDHRVNVSSYDLEGVLNGDIDQFIDALILKDRTEKLEEAGE